MRAQTRSHGLNGVSESLLWSLYSRRTDHQPVQQLYQGLKIRPSRLLPELARYSILANHTGIDSQLSQYALEAREGRHCSQGNDFLVQPSICRTLV